MGNLETIGTLNNKKRVMNLATIKTRAHRKNENGQYDIIYYETDASIVKYGNTTVKAQLDANATDIANKAASDHNHDTVYAPKYTYSTTDLTPGTSSLATGVMYLVYE